MDIADHAVRLQRLDALAVRRGGPLAREAQHERLARTVDVRIEQADPRALRRPGQREIDRDGGLADAALAGGDGHDVADAGQRLQAAAARHARGSSCDELDVWIRRPATGCEVRREARRELLCIVRPRESRAPREREPVTLQLADSTAWALPSVCPRYGSGYSSTSARNSAAAMRAMIVSRCPPGPSGAGILAKTLSRGLRSAVARQHMWHNFCNRVRATKDGRLA